MSRLGLVQTLGRNPPGVRIGFTLPFVLAVVLPTSSASLWYSTIAMTDSAGCPKT